MSSVTSTALFHLTKRTAQDIFSPKGSLLLLQRLSSKWNYVSFHRLNPILVDAESIQMTRDGGKFVHITFSLWYLKIGSPEYANFQEVTHCSWRQDFGEARSKTECCVSYNHQFSEMPVEPVDLSLNPGSDRVFPSSWFELMALIFLEHGK